MLQQAIRNLEGLMYEAPSAEILDVAPEGVFCTSTVNINKWYEEDEDPSLYF